MVGKSLASPLKTEFTNNEMAELEMAANRIYKTYLEAKSSLNR